MIFLSTEALPCYYATTANLGRPKMPGRLTVTPVATRAWMECSIRSRAKSLRCRSQNPLRAKDCQPLETVLLPTSQIQGR